MAYQNQSRHDQAAGKFVEALELGAVQNRTGRLSMQAWYMLHGSIQAMEKSELGPMVQAAMEACKESGKTKHSSAFLVATFEALRLTRDVHRYRCCRECVCREAGRAEGCTGSCVKTMI